MKQEGIAGMVIYVQTLYNREKCELWSRTVVHVRRQKIFTFLPLKIIYQI